MDETSHFARSLKKLQSFVEFVEEEFSISYPDVNEFRDVFATLRSEIVAYDKLFYEIYEQINNYFDRYEQWRANEPVFDQIELL